MCGGKVGDAFDSATESLSNIDPTTSEGLTNVALGGIAGGLADPAGWVDYNLMGGKEEEEMEEAAEEAEQQQRDMIQLYRDQYQSYLDMTAPYREAGESFLPVYQNLISAEGREQFMQDALRGQEFQNIAGAATDQLVSNAAALGNRLSSGIQEDVLSNTGQLATSYASNAYRDRINELGQGVNLGLGAMGTTLQGLNASTAGQAAGLQNIANIGLQQANAAAMQPNMLGGLLGAGAGALLGGPAGATVGYNIGSNV